MDYDPSFYPQAGPSYTNTTPFSAPSEPSSSYTVDYSSAIPPTDGPNAYHSSTGMNGYSTRVGNDDRLSDKDYRPTSGPGSRGGRGSRGSRGVRGSRGSRGSRGRGRGSRGSRGGMRASTRISERIANEGERSTSSANKIQTLKLSFKSKLNGGVENSNGRFNSFLGEYDRELDENPDDPINFEEHFILRVPKEIAEGSSKDGIVGLKDMVKGKSKELENVEFKFLDSRRASFKFNNQIYSAKLVDLPNIIESQKTFDNRHLFKIADISQMMVIDSAIPVKDESSITSNPLKIDEYIWPHGITPPMRFVRKRRFRKRLSRRAIEVVEEQVEELLKKDQDVEEHSYDLIDAHPDPEIADQYYIDYDPNAAQWYNQGESGSEFGGYGYNGEGEMGYDDPGSVAPSQMDDWEGDYGTDMGEGEEGGDDLGDGDEGEDGEDGDEDGTLDQELAAALMEEMEGSDASDRSEDEDPISGSDDDEEEDEGDKSEEDDEVLEKRAKIKQFTAEIKALEAAIEKKRAGFVGGNPIMMKRFEETISGLQADVQAKIASRQILQNELGKPDDSNLPPSDGLGKAVGEGTGTPGSRGDVDMDAEGEDEEEGEGSTPATAAGRRPKERDGEDRGSSVPYSDEDDLFGDEDDYEEGDGETEGAFEGDGENQDQNEEGQYDDDENQTTNENINQQEGGDELEDEMSRLLAAELDTLDENALNEVPKTPEVEANEFGQEDPINDAAAAAALDDLTNNGYQGDGGAFDQDEFSQFNFDMNIENTGAGPGGGGFIEGGVGRRRLASGLLQGDEGSSDSSSDESDD